MSSGSAGFSYAQAAKGLAPSTQNTSNASSSTPSEHGGPAAADANISEKPKATAVEPGVANQELAAGNTANTSSPKSADSAQAQVKDKVASAESPMPSKVSHGALLDAVNHTANTGAILTLDAEERNVKSDKSTQSADTDRSKDTDDDWEKVSVPSVAAEKELKAAPIPAVNFWQQRMEAQEAKLKDIPVSRPTSGPPMPKQKPVVPTAVDEPRRKQSYREADREVTPAQRRTNTGPRTTDRKDSAQVSPRSQAQPDTKTVSPLRAVADTESWPTPDTSNVNDDRRRSSVIERADKADAKGNVQKKWVQMPFVPTAKFETQLPPAAARRGGRPTNRGREGGSRGGFNPQNSSSNERSEAGSMAPPPPPNKSADQDRGRRNTGASARGGRASSVPQPNRAPSQESSARGSTRFSVPHAKDSVESIRAHETQHLPSPILGSDNNSFTNQSRSSSRNPTFVPASRKMEADAKDAVHLQSNQPSAFVDSSGRSQHPERFRASYQEGFRTSYDPSDRGGFGPSRDWSRSRPDLPREKGDPSWRSREPRNDRGRGGYRGRGNHSGYNSHMSPTSFSSTSGQNGFDSSKSPTSAESRNGRQASQPFSQTPPLGANRNNPRSQSIPLASAQSAYYSPMQGYPAHTMSPVEMEFSQYNKTHGGIMSSMPYADQLNSYALISMVITQLEYYFSIDNLCKDMFLRKNMDSQGFVPLGVITGFKRIKALTDGQMSHDQLRSVCQQVRNVEFITGEDGEDRLRSRENWRDFVLPMEERLASAQKDGPSVRTPVQPTSHSPGDLTGTNGSLRSPTAGTNGFAESFGQPMGFSSVTPFDGTGEYSLAGTTAQAPDHVRKTSTTSPFSNVQSPPAHEHVRSPSSYMTNGHHHSLSNAGLGENVFPDEKIPELKVVVRDPAYEANALTDKADPGTSTETTSLRGGAGSPEVTKRFPTMQYVSPPGSTNPSETDQPPYWTKDGEVAKIPTGPGFVHEDYLLLRETAFTQRLDNHLNGALRVLYAFWSSFLVEHFNLSMYEEFVTLATEDLKAGSGTGRTYLLQFYDTLLTSRLTMSGRIASDVVEMAREEKGDRRPLWQKLRTAWRNGATNLKTRKRLGDVLNDAEKAELDKIA